MKRPRILGISGGIASGKSQVTRILESHGAKIIHADRIGHDVLQLPHVQIALTELFGNSILTTHDPANLSPPSIDRKQLAKLVFGNSDQATSRRKQLEALTHPLIRQRIREEIDAAVAENIVDWIVLDIPLLHESSWDKSCDVVWFIDADDSIRLERALQRGWSESDFRLREASQWPVERKRANANLVILNNGSLDSLTSAVEDALKQSSLTPFRL
jgi:dephospho-CoA kinase